MYIEIEAYSNDGDLMEKVQIINADVPSARETIAYYLLNSRFAEVKLTRSGGHNG